MKLSLLPVLIISGMMSGAAALPAQDFPAVAADRAEAAAGFALKGDAPGWLFLRDDVTHASKVPFWKTGPSPALPIITTFRETLKAAGVDLVLVPVPSKAAVYPDKLVEGTPPDAVPSSAPFLEALKTTGATIVDLETPFRTSRDRTSVFCATDSHWSPAGISLAVEAITAVPAVAGLAKPGPIVSGAPATLAITGDLAASPGLEGTPREELTLTKSGSGAASAPIPVPAATTGSSIILMGDSHTMVFTDGASLGMHCQGAGLRDQLQAQLGFPLMQLSNQNSGGTGARRLLSQRILANPDYLKEVKVVVWVFSVREFTLGKWR